MFTWQMYIFFTCFIFLDFFGVGANIRTHWYIQCVPYMVFETQITWLGYYNNNKTLNERICEKNISPAAASNFFLFLLYID